MRERGGSHSTEALAWSEAQNAVTHAYLDAIPVRGRIQTRLTELFNYPKYSVPSRRGDRYYFSKNTGLQNQFVLYKQAALESEASVVLDPNKLSEDGTIALTNQSFSEDGKLLAYGTSASGSDWQEVRIRQVDEGTDYEEVIQWTKFSPLAWRHDNQGFYYSCFPEPGTVPEEDQTNFNKVYWHKVGTPQSDDLLIFEQPDAKELGFSPIVTDDGILFPLSIYRYDFITDTLSLVRGSEMKFDTSGYETEQVFYSSKDGTRVPMFLTHKKGLVRDGSNPTLLYGYGGFNISLTPFFSLVALLWIENGGIYAVANLRGGGEYGEEWHQAGMLDKKQNVFDDFIAAGEWLIANKYTRTERLAINGGSNGGLLTGACLVQRPDLYGAVVCEVPVIDMLRYQKFTVGRYWIPEYGEAEHSAEQFEFLYAYSPLHKVKEGVSYPPTLIMTANTDDRVVPVHAKKFTATLQAAHNGDQPPMLRLEMKAGHGMGKPTTKIIEERSDMLAFLFKTFRMQ